MAKTKEFLVPDYDSMTVEVKKHADKLTKEEKAQLAIYIQAGLMPIFAKRVQSVKQKARSENAKGKNRDFYLKALEGNKRDTEIFKKLCAKPHSFMTAKSWYEHRQDIAKHLGAKTWDSLTDEQVEEGLQWFYTVKFRNGVAIPKDQN